MVDFDPVEHDRQGRPSTEQADDPPTITHSTVAG